MHCKLLWIKVSAKCINVNVMFCLHEIDGMFMEIQGLWDVVLKQFWYNTTR